MLRVSHTRLRATLRLATRRLPASLTRQRHRLPPHSSAKLACSYSRLFLPSAQPLLSKKAVSARTESGPLAGLDTPTDDSSTSLSCIFTISLQHLIVHFQHPQLRDCICLRMCLFNRLPNELQIQSWKLNVMEQKAVNACRSDAHHASARGRLGRSSSVQFPSIGSLDEASDTLSDLATGRVHAGRWSHTRHKVRALSLLSDSVTGPLLDSRLWRKDLCVLSCAVDPHLNAGSAIS